MPDSIPESDSDTQAVPLKPVLMAKHPGKIVADEDWLIIRSLIEAGGIAKDIAAKYGIAKSTIHERSCTERWASPKRVALALKNNDQCTDDPAALVAAMWAKRGLEARESLFQLSSKAMQRFAAMAPVPATFAEAAIAEKMLSKAIDPDSSSGGQSNVSIQLLATQGFQPRRTIDV